MPALYWGKRTQSFSLLSCCKGKADLRVQRLGLDRAGAEENIISLASKCEVKTGDLGIYSGLG